MRPFKLSSATVAALALAGVLAVPGTSDAGDHKIFSGSFCQPMNTDTQFFSYNYTLFGGAVQTEVPGGENSGSGYDFACPVMRDNEANTNGTKFYAWVNDFWGENGDDDIERVVCSVGIRKSDGSGQLDWETRATGVEQTGMVKLDWGTSLSTGEAFAVYYLECFVPVYSGIHSYRTDEP
jgi:hypothetical protein